MNSATILYTMHTEKYLIIYLFIYEIIVLYIWLCNNHLRPERQYNGFANHEQYYNNNSRMLWAMKLKLKPFDST